MDTNPGLSTRSKYLPTAEGWAYRRESGRLTQVDVHLPTRLTDDLLGPPSPEDSLQLDGSARASWFTAASFVNADTGEGLAKPHYGPRRSTVPL